MLFAAALLVTLAVSAPADIKGKWEGKITGQRSDGSASEDAVLLILEQKDSTITGTVGGNESDQHPITSGTIEGNKVTIVAKSASGREYRLELVIENDELKGTLTSGTRKGQIQARRRKE